MALALSRKRFEGVRIGDSVVTVAKITGSRVTLVIHAPDGMPIRRTELDPMQNEFVPGEPLNLRDDDDATKEEVEGSYPF